MGARCDRTVNGYDSWCTMTNNKATASIIVCVYNRADKIADCLTSILAMHRGDYEIVLVDDASNDETPATLEAFKQAHPDIRVQIVRNEENLGVSGTRNAGIQAAHGDFVFFTDSDCSVEPDWLSRMLVELENSGAAAVAGAVVEPEPGNLAERAYRGGSQISRNRMQNRSLIGGNMGFSREVLQRYRFDDALEYGCDEDDLAMRLAADGHRMVFVPQAVVHHHHPLSVRSYLKMALARGRGSARFWYKSGRYIGRDVWAMAAVLITLPLGVFDLRLFAVPAFFFLLQLAAILYNQVVFKGKGMIEGLKVLPVVRRQLPFPFSDSCFSPASSVGTAARETLPRSRADAGAEPRFV